MLLAQRGHALLFCTLMFPTTVDLAASVNQDGLIIGAIVLAAALLTRSGASMTKGTMLPHGFAYWTAALLLACIAAVKPPYAALLLSLPPLRQWIVLRRPVTLRAAVAGLLMPPALLWCWFAMTTVATPFPKLPYEPGPLWLGPHPMILNETSVAAQLNIMLAEPLRFLTFLGTHSFTTTSCYPAP